MRRAASRRVVGVGDLILDEYLGRGSKGFNGGAVPVRAFAAQSTCGRVSGTWSEILESWGDGERRGPVVGNRHGGTAPLARFDRRGGIDRGACCSKRAGNQRKCRLMSSETPAASVPIPTWTFLRKIPAAV